MIEDRLGYPPEVGDANYLAKYGKMDAGPYLYEMVANGLAKNDTLVMKSDFGAAHVDDVERHGDMVKVTLIITFAPGEMVRIVRRGNP